MVSTALNILSTGGYCVCVHAFVHQKVKSLSHTRKSKKRLWMGVVKHWPISIVYADREFELYRSILENIFKTDNISIEKSYRLCLADIIAYLNLRNPQLLRKIKNFREIR